MLADTCCTTLAKVVIEPLTDEEGSSGNDGGVEDGDTCFDGDDSSLGEDKDGEEEGGVVAMEWVETTVVVTEGR